MGKRWIGILGFVLAVALLGGCSYAGMGKKKGPYFTIRFSEDTNIYSAAIDIGEVETVVGQNADNSNFQAGDTMSFDMPGMDSVTFTLRLMHKNGKTVLFKEQLTESFSGESEVRVTLCTDETGKYFLEK